MSGRDIRDAGSFSAWLAEMQRALHGEGDAVVPCAGCTACCTSSQFVHIAPDEHDTLAHIPSELLVPAPRMPRGHVVLGYDERGHCPMLVDGACSIYEHRPRTCRTYDCRIFTATEVVPDRATGEIAERVGSWRFEVTTPADHARRAAVAAAVEDLRAREHVTDPTELATRAVLQAELGDDTPARDRVDE